MTKCFSKPVTQNKSHKVSVGSHGVLEMSALHMNACWKSFKPLVNSCVDNVPVRIAPDLNQPLLQFISALAVCMLNMFLNGHPYLIVTWVQKMGV